MAGRGRAVRFVRSVSVGGCGTSVAGTASVLVATALGSVATSGRSVRASVRGRPRGRCGRESARSGRSRSVGHTVTLVALLAVTVAGSTATTSAELVATRSKSVASVVALATVAVVVTRGTVLAVPVVIAVAAATSAAHSVLGHLDQLRVDDLEDDEAKKKNMSKAVYFRRRALRATASQTHLVRFAQHIDEVARLVRVRVGEQRVRGAGVVRAASTSDAVDVIFRVRRVVVIDYELYVFDVCVF